MAFRHLIHTAYKSTVEAVTSTRSDSAFKTQGVLTPEEFVTSGDYLVRTCPTWSWEAGDAAKAKAYLPRDKQYLVTRNVPSSQRAAAVEGYGAPAGDVMLEGDDTDAWVAPPAEHADATHVREAQPAASAGPRQSPAEQAAGEPQSAGQGMAVPAGTSMEDSADEDIPDLDDLELDDEDADEATLPATAAAGDQQQGETAGQDMDEVVRVRTYDIMISYDKYYQVPRSWLSGYDEARRPLQPKQVLEDVTEEHARKTITVDPFPHTAATAVSIHPCKHAPLMKKLGSMAEAAGRPFTVDTYLILFLKFLASVIPTIEYDYTMTAGW